MHEKSRLKDIVSQVAVFQVIPGRFERPTRSLEV